MADDREYVDLMLDVKNGEVVACEYFGEGRQAEPLTKPTIYMPLESVAFPRYLKQIERRIGKALRSLGGEVT